MTRISIGDVFGRWTVISAPKKRSHMNYWPCRCLCGTERAVRAGALLQGKSLSCGCLAAENASVRNRTHGQRKSPEWRIWLHMRQRCELSSHKSFKDYGGRGISVCDRWQHFESFLADMGQRPSRSHSIDRKDNDGNYEPGNCRWVIAEAQANNRRSNRRITYKGKTLTVSQWARRTGIPYQTIYWRLNKGLSAAVVLSGGPNV